MQRPISPHLQIYKLPLAVIMSITHRVTGAYFYFGLIIVVWWYYFSVFSSQFFLSKTLTWFLYSFFGKLFIASWIFSFFFHTVSGIRHLVWDLGVGFSLRTVKITNLVVIGLSIIFTFMATLAIM